MGTSPLVSRKFDVISFDKFDGLSLDETQQKFDFVITYKCAINLQQNTLNLTKRSGVHRFCQRFILIRGGTEAYSVFFIVFRQVTQCLALSGQNSLPTQQICLKFNQPHSYLFWPSQIRLKEEGELSETTVVLWLYVLVISYNY